MKNDNIIKEFLEEKYFLYNRPEFIDTDPIQIPHLFSKKGDIEISGFLAATIAWGNRKNIIKSALRMMSLINHAPADFVLNASEKDLDIFNNYVYRTFNSIDLKFFIKSLQNIYKNHGGLGRFFENSYSKSGDIKQCLIEFYKLFFNLPHHERTRKHLANVERKSAAKRMNMFLRWMVRRDDKGIDFGLWEKIPPKALYLPLDVHTGNVGRKLGLLKRKQNDWKSVKEITDMLKTFDANDPIKYDYALFGLGVFEKF